MNSDSTASQVAGTKSRNTAAGYRPPYRLYGAMFLLFFLVRFGDLLVRDMEWTVRFHNSWLATCVAVVMATVASLFTAHYLNARVPSLMAWLMCGLVGASAMLLTNTGYGMVIGFMVGAMVIWRRLWLRVLTADSKVYAGLKAFGLFCWWLLRRLLLPATVGLATGVFAALTYIHFGQATRVAEVASLGLSLVIGTGMFILGIRKIANKRWYSWVLAVPLFFVFALAGLLLTIAADAQRRRMQIAHVGVDSNGLVATFVTVGELYPVVMKMPQSRLMLLGAANEFTRGCHFDGLSFRAGSQDEEVEVLRGLPVLTSLSFERGSQVTDAAVKRLSLRYVGRFSVAPETRLTDETVRLLDKSKLYMLELEGPNFSDASLNGIENMPILQNLSLKGTDVTSKGLGQLDPTSPLNYLDLSETQVDDEIFPLIARLPSLGYLDLSGTRITGRGLKHLRDTSIQLRLSNTSIDERYLADLLPGREDENQWNAPTIPRLELKDVQLSDVGFESIAKLPGLGILDVRGSDVSSYSMRLLSKLPLSLLELDVGRLTPEDLGSTNWATELRIHYDANTTDVARIKEHIEALSLLRPKSVTADIQNVRLTTENMADILAAVTTAGAWQFELPGAVDSEGRSRSFYDVRAELPIELSSTESPE